MLFSWNHRQNFTAINQKLIRDDSSFIQLLKHNLQVKTFAIEIKCFLDISVLLFVAR